MSETTKIVKRGPGNYIAKCNVCGWREEMKMSLAKVKAATKEHAESHVAVDPNPTVHDVREHLPE